MSGFTVRLVLPPGWYELGRDDPGAWTGSLVQSLLPHDVGLQDALADDVIDAYGLAEARGAVDALVHVPQPEQGVRATLLSYPWRRRALLRRGPGAYAAPLCRDLRSRGARTLERTDVALPSGPSVRVRGQADDELGRSCEHVVHVVVPPGAPGAVLLHVQWPAGRPDADELAATADRIAHDALVEVL